MQKIDMSSSRKSAVVLNMDRIVEKDFTLEHQSSTNNMSLKPQVNIDDLSIALTDIPEKDADDNKSLSLNEIEEETDACSASAALSESANSSSNFSFTNESTGENADSYPALYAPEKQREYEEEKIAAVEKEKYGAMYPFVRIWSGIKGGAVKVMGTVTDYFDKMCGTK